MSDAPLEERLPRKRSAVARVVMIALALLALSVAGLVAVAVLNPQPEPQRVDYGGFTR